MVINLTQSKRSVLNSIEDSVEKCRINPTPELRAAAMLGCLSEEIANLTGIDRNTMSITIGRVFYNAD